MSKTLKLIAASCLLFVGCGTALSQAYPDRPIRMIIGFPPGGGADIIGRIVAQRLSDVFGQQVIVDNRGGASGQIAAQLTANAVPDGYTIMLSTVTTFSILPLLTKLPFDTLKDFTPITLLASAPNLLVVHPSVPAKSVKELIAFAKTHAGQLLYASPGLGSPQHLAGELFKMRAGIDMRHVPYKGSGQSIVDLVSGQVHLNFDQISVVKPYVTQGKLRALAVTSANRFSLLPEVPTISESGFEFDLATWWGLHTQAAVRRNIVVKLNADTVRLLRQADVKDKIASVGAEAVGNSPDEFALFLRSEAEKLAVIAKAAKLKID